MGYPIWEYCGVLYHLGPESSSPQVEVALGGDFGVSADLWDDSDDAGSNESLALLGASGRRIFPIAFPTSA